MRRVLFALEDADAFLIGAEKSIDLKYGKGWAAAHPELVGYFMLTAAINFHARNRDELMGDLTTQRDIFDIDALRDWIHKQSSNFSIATAATDGLKLDASKLTQSLRTRIGILLRKLGCVKVEKRNSMTRHWYKPPAACMRKLKNKTDGEYGG